MAKRKWKPKQNEVCFFEPTWWKSLTAPIRHPLHFGDRVYYLGDIPNVPGHCIVATDGGKLVPMIHTDELRQATEDEI